MRCDAPNEITMKERPILFSAPMVRAILEGRKTQTRRIVKPQDSIHGPTESGGVFWIPEAMQGEVEPNCAAILATERCPYGQPGDQLWVKETFRVNGTMAGPRVTYAADKAEAFPKGCPDDCPDWVADDNHWRPSIFMRRYASRIQLSITSVRVERLNDCSEEDAKAEGVHWDDGLGGWSADEQGGCFHASSPVIAYEKLWESINSPGSWTANPWVWVITFERING